LGLLSPLSARSAGVTVITHGYAGDVTGWITEMASQITNYSGFPGTNSTTYTITLTTDGTSIYYQWSRGAGAMPTNTDSGEIIVKLDWSQMAGGLSAPYDISTYNVAAAASWVLSQTNSISDLGGHALVEFPIHLIGHSRGGSLMSEISRQLGTNGIWIDHLTTLDPHPLNNDGNDDSPITVIDAPVHTYSNVLFHDNYWQNLGDGTFVPDGEPVSGAYVRKLYYLIGGYPSAIYDFLNLYEYHSNVHLWYDGTIDLNVPTSYNDDGTIIMLDATMRTDWWVSYENYGSIAGFNYSLIGGGDRTSTDRPLGLPSDPAIRDGYNQNWDTGGGSDGNRTALTSNSGTWPDIIKLNITGTNAVQKGNSFYTTFYYQYAGTSNLTAQIFYDGDFNPYNSNSVLVTQVQAPSTGAGSVYYYSNVGLNTTNVSPGTYAVYGKITDGVHSRYIYAPQIIQVLPAVIITSQPSSQTVWAGTNVTFGVTAAGVPTLKYQWQKNSVGVAGATNANYTINNVTTNAAGNYSCVVSNAFGNATSSNAVLTVLVADITKPTISITSPTNSQRWSNVVFNVTGTAGDNVQVSNVWCQINGLGWNLASNGNNWSNWTAQVTLTPGTNTIAAYSVDTSGNFSLTNSVSFQYVVTNQLQVFMTGLGTIAPNYNNSWLEIGRNYSMTATPGNGFRFTNWTGSLITSAATLNFTMASNLTFTANFIDTNRPALSITNLSAGQRWSNVVFTAKGTATDNWQVASVQFQLNGGIWTNATGTTNWSAPLTLTPGTNTFAAYAADTTGNNSPTNSVSFQFVVTNQLQVRMTGLGTISPTNYTNAWLEIGRNYSITSAPASGFVFTNWLVSTNWIGGATMSKTNLQFMMASNLTLQANFLDVARPTNRITAPTAGQHMTNALATVIGTASDNWKVTGVWYQLNNGPWNQPATTNSYTNWSTTVTLLVGTNTVKAYAVDLGGNYSTTNNLNIVSSNTFKLQLDFATAQPLQTNGLNFILQISSNLNGHIQVSTNLLNWVTLTNFVGTNTTLNFRDATATNFNLRFYRAVIP
jgi:hypothetical protein